MQQWRITRHDKVLNLVLTKLSDLGYTTLKEPHISTPEGLRKPDILMWKTDEVSLVLDVQVTSDANVASLGDLHARKIAKYDNPSIKAFGFTKSGVIPRISAVTINWRGIIARDTSRLLKELGFNNKDLNLLGVRALAGGLSIYSNYMATSGGGLVDA